MKRVAQTLGVGAGVATGVFLAAALFASPNELSHGSVQDAWGCFWAAGACAVLAAASLFWSIDA